MSISSKTISKKGLASASEATRERVASLGGKAAHKSGNAHRFKKGSSEAKKAGTKGGENSHRYI